MGQSAAHLAHPSPLPPPPPPPLFTLPYYYRVYAKAFWSDVAQLEMSPFRKNMPSTAESSTSYRDNNVREKCWLNHCPSMQKVNFLLINN